MKKESYNKLDGKTRNLVDQVNKLFKGDNQKSIKTRHRYLAAEERFCKWLSENTNIKKIANVKVKHFIKYTEELKQKGLSSNMLKAELSGVRHFHSLTGSIERLPENKRLGLPKVNTNGGVNRSWTPQEVQKAVDLAERDGRIDVATAIKVSYAMGSRIEETITLTTNQVKDAIKNKQLDLINTKGARPRGVGVGTNSKYANMQLRALQYALEHSKNKDKVFIKPGEQTHAVIKSVQNWIYYNRDKFQKEDRINRDAAREIADKARDNKLKIERPKAELTAHGLRHSFANNMYKEILTEKIKEYKESKEYNRGRERDHSKEHQKDHERERKDIREREQERIREIEKEARLEVSALLGHGRDRITLVYVNGEFVSEEE